MYIWALDSTTLNTAQGAASSINSAAEIFNKDGNVSGALGAAVSISQSNKAVSLSDLLSSSTNYLQDFLSNSSLFDTFLKNLKFNSLNNSLNLELAIKNLSGLVSGGWPGFGPELLPLLQKLSKLNNDYINSINSLVPEFTTSLSKISSFSDSSKLVLNSILKNSTNFLNNSLKNFQDLFNLASTLPSSSLLLIIIGKIQDVFSDILDLTNSLSGGREAFNKIINKLKDLMNFLTSSLSILTEEILSLSETILGTASSLLTLGVVSLVSGVASFMAAFNILACLPIDLINSIDGFLKNLDSYLVLAKLSQSVVSEISSIAELVLDLFSAGGLLLNSIFDSMLALTSFLAMSVEGLGIITSDILSVIGNSLFYIFSNLATGIDITMTSFTEIIDNIGKLGPLISNIESTIKLDMKNLSSPTLTDFYNSLNKEENNSLVKISSYNSSSVAYLASLGLGNTKLNFNVNDFNNQSLSSFIEKTRDNNFNLAKKANDSLVKLELAKKEQLDNLQNKIKQLNIPTIQSPDFAKQISDYNKTSLNSRTEIELYLSKLKSYQNIKSNIESGILKPPQIIQKVCETVGVGSSSILSINKKTISVYQIIQIIISFIICALAFAINTVLDNADKENSEDIISPERNEIMASFFIVIFFILIQLWLVLEFLIQRDIFSNTQIIAQLTNSALTQSYSNFKSNYNKALTTSNIIIENSFKDINNLIEKVNIKLNDLKSQIGIKCLEKSSQIYNRATNLNPVAVQDTLNLLDISSVINSINFQAKKLLSKIKNSNYYIINSLLNFTEWAQLCQNYLYKSKDQLYLPTIEKQGKFFKIDDYVFSISSDSSSYLFQIFHSDPFSNLMQSVFKSSWKKNNLFEVDSSFVNYKLQNNIGIAYKLNNTPIFADFYGGKLQTWFCQNSNINNIMTEDQLNNSSFNLIFLGNNTLMYFEFSGYELKAFNKLTINNNLFEQRRYVLNSNEFILESVNISNSLLNYKNLQFFYPFTFYDPNMNFFIQKNKNNSFISSGYTSPSAAFGLLVSKIKINNQNSIDIIIKDKSPGSAANYLGNNIEDNISSI